ncbi:MAG TPA: BON domain-containing protein [Candidatus Sulfotelmatobacter sp.]
MQRIFTFVAQAAIVTCLLTGITVWASAQDSSSQADNTKVNRNDTQPTADQQKLDHSDRDIAKQIRQSVVKDKSLSTYAHNVKIISQNGMVTLRGLVRSEDEKRAIEADAAAVVGQDKVTSEIEVQPKK